jgi:serine/threonine-protein kinase ULK/ATG1
MQEILQGFYNLREKNIVHRDIKPANLLMHNYSLRIADLGFSKCIDSHEQLLESVVGSPLYMSPQIFERKKYTEKTDIWSLGAIFYEMLYGKSPFAGCKNLMELK